MRPGLISLGRIMYHCCALRVILMRICSLSSVIF